LGGVLVRLTDRVRRERVGKLRSERREGGRKAGKGKQGARERHTADEASRDKTRRG
jgi:hypothetical protein